MHNPYLQEVNLPVALFERQVDNSFQMMWANDAWWITTSLVPDQCLNHPMAQWLVNVSRAQVAMQLDHIDRIKGSVRFVLPLALEQGDSLFDAFLHPIDHVEGNAAQVMITLQDVTQEQHLRQTLATQNQFHQETVQQMKQFVAFAAHDLRSPMRNVEMIAAMLKDDFEDHGDGKLEMIEMLGDIGRIASKTIDDLLKYSQSDALIDQVAEFDMQDIQSDLELILNPNKQHTLTFPAVRLESDPTVLRIILQNLIDNSIKHTDRPSTEVSIDIDDTGLGMLECIVTDAGVGFDNPATAFLRSKEFKYDSGFGLFGISRLIANKGGSIRAISPESGQGAKILFQIPGRLKEIQREFA